MNRWKLILVTLTCNLVFQACLQCITGGNLHIKKRYVSNVCGLANAVYVEEILVDSFKNKMPATYKTVLSANLYKSGANSPRRLYFARDCNKVFLWKDHKITDTLQQPLLFRKNSWYLFSSNESHMKLFMFVDQKGKRHLQEKSEKADIINF